MDIKKLRLVYFSPTGTTQSILWVKKKELTVDGLNIINALRIHLVADPVIWRDKIQRIKWRKINAFCKCKIGKRSGNTGTKK
jgi:hypothetical protein